MTPLLSVEGIAVSIGGKPLIADVGFAVMPRERMCLVGRNGSGKSTILKIAAGMIEADAGKRFVQPGTTIRYLPQEPDLSGWASVLDYVESGLGPSDDPYRARRLLNELGLAGDELPARLSGGEARRAALACAIAPEPDILLLDEPTNHLDLPAIEWLEGELGRTRSALVLISHDRRFLQTLTRATLWLDRGRLRRLDEGFSAFEAWRDTVLEQEESERHKLDRQIAREEDWLRYGVTARRKRNVRRLGALGDLRAQRRDAQQATGSVRLQASEGAVSGKLVVEAKDISKSYGDRRIVSGFSMRIARGDRIGIVGPNGAGKTTLLNMLTGIAEPDSGTVKLGANLEIASIDQRRASLDPAATLRAALTGGAGDTVFVGGQPKHVMSYLRDFLFQPEQANAPVGILSGGERGRLMLARALSLPANLLVLDEPTNDLDLETLDLLQEMVADYPGTVLLVSHDRDFLDRTVTSVLGYEGEGRWTEYAGGYSDMVAQRGAGVLARIGDAPFPSARSNAARPAAKPAGKQKLSFQQQHDLTALPARMETLGAAIAKLQVELGDPALYARDPDGFQRVSERLQSVQAELEAVEERWLALEMLREELQQAG